MKIHGVFLYGATKMVKKLIMAPCNKKNRRYLKEILLKFSKK